MAQYINRVGYGLTQPLNSLAPFPIKANRAPTTADLGYPVGQIWVYTASNEVYILGKIASNSATWNLLAASGSAGTFSSLTVTGAVNLNTTGAAANVIGNTTGAGSLALRVGTGGFSVDGAVSSSYAVGASATVGNITLGGVNQTGNIIIGQSTAGQTIQINGTSGTNATIIQAGTGGVTLNAPFVALPGPVYIYTGAGAPGNGLALHIGDLYINRTAANATTRMYIATAVGTWTNITCAA